jgi:hypothetical protein
VAVTRLLPPDNNSRLPNTTDFTPEDGESWKQSADKINTTMQRAGQTVVDFGAFPGTDTASVAVTGQDDITADAIVETFILYADSTDHSADEHLVDPPHVTAGSISAGTGFTIYSNYRGTTNLYGKWSVGWRWSKPV